MKEKLLKLNITFFTLLYSLSLFDIGFYWGDGWDNYYPPSKSGFVTPAVHLILLLWGVYLLCNRKGMMPRAYLILGVSTLLHIPLLLGLSIVITYLNSAWPNMITPGIDWYPTVVYILSALIGICYIICAVLTHQEYKEIRRKRQETAT